jgi:aminoglycoside phosphotransferase (APT) family kinase protein
VLPLVADDTLAVLDWENAGPLHADGELANALLSWTAGAGHVSAEAALALLEAYRAGGGSQLSLSRASFNVAAATQLNFLKVMADQTLVESKHTAFALEMVNGLLDGSFERLRTYIAQLVSALDLPPA